MRSTTSTRQQRLTGLERRSCAWLDAIGPGYAVGASGAVLEQAARVARSGYCR